MLDRGHAAIADAVAKCKPPVVVIEMLRMFGDVLHSTLVVQHYRKVSRASIVWAISEKYVETFAPWVAPEGPDAIAGLPDGPPFPKDGPLRVAWVRRAAELPGVKRVIGCGVHPWGWQSGTIIEGILHNAGIDHLSVPRRPFCPLTPEDVAWADNSIAMHDLSEFTTLEFESTSLAGLSVQDCTKLFRRVGMPVVALGGPTAAIPQGALDGRSTFRQAKALIERSSCFIGISAGLTQLAATTEVPIAEYGPYNLSLQSLGYVGSRRYGHACSLAELPGVVKRVADRPATSRPPRMHALRKRRS
jgi:hypothetical protein